jgi:hypothetical protein
VWIQQVWSGRVEDVITALDARQSELGTPEPGEPETGPRVEVADALTYLRNNWAKTLSTVRMTAGVYNPASSA